MTILNDNVEKNKKIFSIHTKQLIDIQTVTLENGEPLVLVDKNGRLYKIFFSEEKD